MGKLVAGDLLQPLNHELIPALQKDNWKTFRNPYYDQGWRYSVPYTIYTTGIGYRRDQIPDDVIHGMANPWEILWDPQYAGRSALPQLPRCDGDRADAQRGHGHELQQGVGSATVRRTCSR